jgi:uncharacterized protein (TIGR03118 family)
MGGSMMHNTTWHINRTFAAICVATVLVACDDTITNNPQPLSKYDVTNLVADASGAGAPTVDPNLVNPWGVAFGPTGILWVANEATGTSTLYDASGATQSLVVAIPSATAATGGKPTATVFNSTSDFVIPGGASAKFLFAGIDGVISGWEAGTSAKVVVDRTSQDAEYLGLAIASDGNSNFLYAANFKNNKVDVFDATFQFVKSFTDPNIPAGYGPFSINTINGRLVVTYAKQKAAPDNDEEEVGLGLGYVDVFNPDGTVSSRFASQGRLNAPWGVTIAPAGFGSFSGAVLIGNFGDGLIGVYDPSSGAFIDYLRDENDEPIALEGLWGLTFGQGAQGSTLFFAAGTGDETHGLVGKITVR